MTKINIIRALRVGAAPLAIGMALTSVPALAQDSVTEDTTAQPSSVEGSEAAEGDAIVVTGSRIPQANLTSSAPVTTVTSQDLKLQGVTKVEDLLNSLPQVSAGQASSLSNGASGIATVDLRGLGSVRTLVLVNGRRLLPGDPTDSSADLNAIPDSLVKRVEVLTGGASSTYGADAVSGVVNFILDTDFTGIQLDSQYSFYNHNNRNSLLPGLLDARQAQGFSGFNYPTGHVADGGTINANLTLGAGFDDNRGHVTAYVGYRKVNAVTQDRRDYSACTIQDASASAQQCGGSSTSAPGNALIFEDGGTSSTFYQVGPNRTLIPGRTRYNFAPTNYFQRPDERYTAGLFAHYDINDSIKPYMEFMFMDDRTLAQIAPSGDFGNTLTINCDNPTLSAQAVTTICNPSNLVTGFLGTFPLTPVTNPDDAAAPVNFIDPTTGATYNRAFFQLLRRNVEGGPRIADLQHTQYRAVIGTKGDLGPIFSYDASYQYGRTNYTQVYSNEFSTARLNRALDIVAGPGGTFQCRSARTGEDPNCVPYDIFNPAGPSAASIAYVSATGFQKAIVSEQIAGATVTALLGEAGVKSPLADEGLSINGGFEYRKESLDLQTDNAFSTGDLTGQGAPTKPVKGSFHVTEFFAEAILPIIRDGFVSDLSLNGGYRYSKYKISNGREFSTDTYKVGVNFSPISDITFRGGYNRAVRAPNLQELFAPNIVALDGSTDPCAGFAITAADVGCLAQGLRVGQTVAPNPAGQYNGLIGGTPTLNPEKATTKTLGVVVQPRFVPGFAVTVDYYDIKIRQAIQGFGADAIVNECTTNATPLACSLVNRNPVSGSLWLTPDGYITDLSQNIGGVRTKGIDVNGTYNHQLGALGRLGLTFNGTYLDSFVVDNGLSEPYDCAGYYGSTCSTGQGGVPSAPNAKWRHKARASFTADNGVGVSFQWRYFGPVKVDFSSPDSALAGDFDPFSSRLKSQSYFDLAFTANIGDHYTFRLGANNLLDRQPPLVTSGRADGTRNQCPSGPCNGNTYPAVYDALGRYIYAGVQLNF